jgi:hypothetical protein
MRRIGIGVVVAAMVLAACGGSSKKSVASGGSTTTTSSAGSSATSGGGSGGDSDLSALAGQYAKSKIKITYASSGTDTFTFAQDGNGKTAFTSGNSTFYSDGKSSVSCEGTGATAKCTDLSGLGGGTSLNLGATFTASFAALAGVLSTLGGGHKTSETIAGRDASCVTYKAADLIGRLKGLALFKGSTASSSAYDPNDTATICIDKSSGFVVKVASTKKGQPQDELTATSVGEPSSSDFTPPVTPETVPKITIPGGGTIPGLTPPSG